MKQLTPKPFFTRLVFLKKGKPHMTVDQFMTILSPIAMIGGFLFQVNRVENKILNFFYSFDQKLDKQNIRLSYLSSPVTELDRFLEKIQNYPPRKSPEISSFPENQSDFFKGKL